MLCDFVSHYHKRKEVILKALPDDWEYWRTISDEERETSLNLFTTWELSLEQISGATEATESARWIWCGSLVVGLCSYPRSQGTRSIIAVVHQEKKAYEESRGIVPTDNPLILIRRTDSSQIFNQDLIKLPPLTKWI